MRDAFKTRKMHTIPVEVTPSTETVPPTPAGAGTPSSSHMPASTPVSSYGVGGPPSSDGTWVTEHPATERATDPQLAVPTGTGKDRATLTVLKGTNAGQVFALDGTDHVIGRGTEADVWIDDTGVSRRHARVSCGADGVYRVVDLGSTNGTFLSARRVTDAELRPGDRVQLGPNVVLRFAITDDAEEELQRRLYESSTRDALTRVYNRTYFSERLTAEVAHSRRHRVKLAVLILDLDDFKKINDTYGHLAGDMVLRLVSAQMQRLIRVEDLLARYGGEEFVVLARSTGKTEAVRLAERIRKSIRELDVPVGEHPAHITLSVGVASVADVAPDGGPNELLALADARLYRAKAAGKDRVVAEGA